MSMVRGGKLQGGGPARKRVLTRALQRGKHGAAHEAAVDLARARHAANQIVRVASNRSHVCQQHELGRHRCRHAAGRLEGGHHCTAGAAAAAGSNSAAAGRCGCWAPAAAAAAAAGGSAPALLTRAGWQRGGGGQQVLCLHAQRLAVFINILGLHFSATLGGSRGGRSSGGVPRRRRRARRCSGCWSGAAGLCFLAADAGWLGRGAARGALLCRAVGAAAAWGGCRGGCRQRHRQQRRQQRRPQPHPCGQH